MLTPRKRERAPHSSTAAYTSSSRCHRRRSSCRGTRVSPCPSMARRLARGLPRSTSRSVSCTRRRRCLSKPFCNGFPRPRPTTNGSSHSTKRVWCLITMSPNSKQEPTAVPSLDGTFLPSHYEQWRARSHYCKEVTMSDSLPTEPGLDLGRLRQAIQEEYAAVARDPARGYHFHTGRPLASRLGYHDDWLEDIPEGSIASFAGTGHPFRIGQLQPGERVIDIGSGAGID